MITASRVWRTWLLILVIYLLWKSVIVSIALRLSHNKFTDKEFFVKFLGRFYGRFLGLIVGGFIGGEVFTSFHLEDFIGFFVGGVIFYFIGRWLGSYLSLAISRQVDKSLRFSIPPVTDEIVKTSQKFPILFISYSIFYLGLVTFITAGLLIDYFHVQVGFFPEYLYVARIIAIILSIFTLIYPWFMRKSWLTKYSKDIDAQKTMVNILGLASIVAPAVYGLTLFLAFGISLVEFFGYIAISFVVSAIWWLKNRTIDGIQKINTTGTEGQT